MAKQAFEALGRRWQRFSQPGQAQLQVHLPGQASRLVPLHPGIYRIGRDKDCQICVDHPAVSRQHALLERRGSHWLLIDDSSTNGLWWQGRRVQQLLLRDGDSLRFGPSQEAGLPELDFQIRPLPQMQRLLRATSLMLAPASRCQYAAASPRCEGRWFSTTGRAKQSQQPRPKSIGSSKPCRAIPGC